MSVASNIKIASKYFRTNDGGDCIIWRRVGKTACSGSWLLANRGAILVSNRKPKLADRYRGERARSTRPWRIGETDFGLKIHRLAEDLREALIAAKATIPPLLGHSMGRSVIWAY